MAAFVQAAKGSSSTFATSVATAALASSTTTGNTMVVCIATDGATANDVTSVTDTAGNSYSRINSTYDVPDSDGIEWWIARNITGGASQIVTAHDSLSNLGSIVATEVSGLPTSGNITDGYGGTAAFTNSLTATTAGSTANAADIIFGAGSTATAAANTWTVGSGYSNLTTTVGTNAGINLAVESKVVAATGSQTATLTATTGAGSGSIMTVLALSSSVLVGVTGHNLATMGVGI